MAVNDILEARAYSGEQEQRAQNVLHWRVTGEVLGGVTEAEIANQFKASWSGLYTAIMGVTANFLGVSVQRIRPTRGDAYNSIGVAFPGTSGAQIAPSQACAISLFYSAFPGRRGKGRCYIPFIATNQLNANGFLSAGGLATLQFISQQLATAAVITVGGRSSQLTPCVLSRAGNTTHDIISFSSHVKIGTQRRRGDFGKAESSPFG